MKICRVVVVFAVLAIISGCYLPISGRIIDAETLQPIEGAVVLAEWTKTKGYGFTYTESYKVVEAVSDKDGKVKIDGCFCPFTNPPDLTIYKKGYVAWNNKLIFPSDGKKQNFKWSRHYVFQTERFKDTFSYDDHYYFIISAAHPESATEKKKLFLHAYDEWEREKAVREREQKRRGGSRQ